MALLCLKMYVLSEFCGLLFVVLWLSKETPQYEAWIIETSAATLAV